MLLEHLAEVFPRHIQIHYGQYHREQLFEDERALAGYLEAIKQAQSMRGESVHQFPAEQFDSRRIVDQVIATLTGVREWAVFQAANVVCPQS
jgi:hypothetical protein